DPNDEQYWVKPILCEETRARLEHFRKLGWLSPNYKPKTLMGIAVVERYWRRYCAHLNEDYMTFLLSEDQAIYMNFFDWMYKTSKEKTSTGEGSASVRGVATNPGPSNTNTAKGGTRKRKQDESFKSDLPQPISFDDLPHTVCYRDVELFYLKNTGGRDILCAIIEFRNLKGRPEGADGTKFFMHGDYQLVYCPITYIVSLAFRDEAFENDALTPESIWRLKVPKRNRALPLRWKEVVDRPLLRRFVHAGFEDKLGHYNFRRWTANEANLHFTDQERNRVLGQSGSRIFERHYQKDFIPRDLQQVVLLRPSQEGLVQRAAGMLRKRDPLAPSDLNDDQIQTIRRHPRILELRWEKREFKEEMRSLAGTIQNAFPELYQRHNEVSKKLTKLRKVLRDDTRQKARKDYFLMAPVLEVDRQIQQLLGKPEAGDPNNTDDEDDIRSVVHASHQDE
ncbi:hypothetical protein Egran_04941, partial [Elaphomyces granulatus]